MDYKSYNDYELIYMVREKDEDSYGILFKKYMPIVRSIALEYYKKYSNYGHDFSDFLQEGYLAFQNCISKYDENGDALFYTFVSICIRRHLISFCIKITCSTKNISNDYLVDIDNKDVYGINMKLDENISFEKFLKDMWDIVYSFDDIIYSSIFELRLNNFKYLEIAKLLDMDVKQIMQIQRKIYKLIRRKMDFNL